MDKHICNPKATMKCGTTPMYQCGCGRYWSDEDKAIKQQKKYYKSVSAELNKGIDNE
jgi:hypothetical protein